MSRQAWSSTYKAPMSRADDDPLGDWASQARCRDRDPETFFATTRTGGVDKARACCAVCPVQPQCLAYALALPWLHGVWGGTTPEERDRMRRATKRLRAS